MAVVTKKSRGRFPMPLAQPGLEGLIVNTWIAHSGSEKITILTEDLTTYCTTLKCVSVSDVEESEKWKKLKGKYDEINSIPVIVKCMGIGPKAYRLKSLNNKLFFLNHYGNPRQKKGDCFSVTVPVWLAIKEGILIDK